MKNPLRFFTFFSLALPFLFLLTFFQNQSQTFQNQGVRFDPEPKTFHNCGFDGLHSTLNPNVQELLKNYEKSYQQYIAEQQNNPEDPPDFILPVVVHLIHNGGTENISDAQVEQAILDLNEAFENIGYYNPNTGVDTKIQFCLAKQDPNGDPSTGINRVQSPLTDMTMETQDLSVKDLSRWDPLQYINIWVVREISSLSVGPGVAGYAYFPTSHGSNEDGIMCEANYFGSTKANSGVHIHEMGHYLGLYHTFEGGCTNNDCMIDGDRVCDTSPDQSTAPVPCGGDANTCATDTNSGFPTDQNDMFWNYMDYGDLNCYSAFTQGQTDRMTFTIENIRFSLLNSKGCEDPCPMPVEVAFSASQTQIIVNGTVNFTNNSTGGSSWEWQVDSDPPFATSINASYTFNQTGIYWVYLTANPGDPLCEERDSVKIKVALCGQNAHVSDQFGIDSPGCGDLGNRCRTIQYALDNIVCDTDTVFIHSGQYALPSGVDDLTAVAHMPEGLSITLFGVWDNGPVVIDGNGQRRGIQYNYLENVCPDSHPNDGIDETVELNFTNLNFQNCQLNAFMCNNTTISYGGAVQLYNDLGSQLYVSFHNCQFWNNLILDPDGPNNNGRAASGAAIYMHGRENANAPIGTEASLTIDSCLFVNNRCDQLPNGGHGGAICVIQTHDVQISESVFCNNSVYSENSDDGDLGFKRNAGGAIVFFDNTSQNPPHVYQIEDSYLIGNSALTADGAMLPNSSGAGGAYLLYNTGPPSPTPNIMSIANSFFYDNTNEDGQFHYGNNTGNVQVDNVQTGEDFIIHLGNDTSLCDGGNLIIGDTLPFGTYMWSTGDTTATIMVSEVDIYAVTVTMGECQGIGSIEILPCETCGNGLDDDGDGLIDCDDPDLQNTCCCITPPILDLGNDIVICENGINVLDAGDGFLEYTWQDGFTQSQTYTAWLPGTYWVDVLDICGDLQSDTITILVDPASMIDLGNDTLICEGETLTFSLNGFDTYQWQPSISLNCDDCPTVIASPLVSTTYIVSASNSSGCITTDTINVAVLPDNGDITDDVVICEGDSISVFGQIVTQTGTFIDTISNAACEYFHTINVAMLDTVITHETRYLCAGDSINLKGNIISQAGTYPNIYSGFNGCDSTQMTEIILLDTFFTMESMSICFNDTAIIFGNEVSQSGYYSMTFPSQNGCDSTHQIKLEVLETTPSFDTTIICFGESILIFGNLETQAGIYAQTTSAANGCDSTHTITLEVLDQLTIDFQTLPSCENETNGTAQALIGGGLPPYQYIWEPSNQNTDAIFDLAPGEYGFTVIDDYGCQMETSFTIISNTEEDIEIETQNETCFGDLDGVLTVLSSNPNIQYSLDGQSFSPQTTFGNLAPGDYILQVLDQNNCRNELEFSIFQATQRIVNLPPDTILCLGDSIQIISQHNVSGNVTYEWSPNFGLSCIDCPRPNAQPVQNTLYTLIIFDENGCQASDNILIEIESKRNVFVPNVFSPNDDGLNDLFYPFAGANVSQILDFKIFDRWGELVHEQQNFQPNDPNFGWNGFFDGKHMNPAVFVWIMEVEFLDGEIAIIKGDVVLVR